MISHSRSLSFSFSLSLSSSRLICLYTSQSSSRMPKSSLPFSFRARWEIIRIRSCAAAVRRLAKSCFRWRRACRFSRMASRFRRVSSTHSSIVIFGGGCRSFSVSGGGTELPTTGVFIFTRVLSIRELTVIIMRFKSPASLRLCSASASRMSSPSSADSSNCCNCPSSSSSCAKRSSRRLALISARRLEFSFFFSTFCSVDSVGATVV
uniref:Uncharacterized protein n=1 Tax=Anopheles atroparvus TaxID=41427 RepID=A0AAG5CRJ7_ANOAO